jgi:hypothetical protein
MDVFGWTYISPGSPTSYPTHETRFLTIAKYPSRQRPNGYIKIDQGKEGFQYDLLVKLLDSSLTPFPAKAPASKETKAKNAKKAALVGAHSTTKRKVRTSVSFHRPKTLRLPRTPKYQRKSVNHVPRMDQHRVIIS